jgi:quercetin dioxygenase-like cupin family protein
MAGSARFADVEWLARTVDVGVRINTLDPEASTPWHSHTVVADDVFCLEDPVEIELRGPDERVELAPGQRRRIAPGRIHRVVNRAGHQARYLLVQAGPYDFNEVSGPGR